jgi:hypothetical protein
MRQINNMINFTKENIINELINEVPEFKNFRKFEADKFKTPTIIFDAFGDFILEKILASTQEDASIVRSFGFINKIMELDNPDLQNLPIIGVFEVLAGSKKGLEIGYKYLNDNGKHWLKQVSKNFKAR